jgi:DNA-binding transcriptional LysR family regulator
MAKPYTLTQLRYFAEVAKYRSMTAASATLGVTQSAVSTAVSELEKALGVQLLVRNKATGLALTNAGRRFNGELAAFLEHADTLAETARALSAPLSGPLVVGVFAPLAPFRLPVILQRFNEDYPDITVSLLEADLATLAAAVLDGRCDLALMYGLGLDARFESTVVERIPPHVLVNAKHPAAQTPQTPVALADFADEPAILLDLPLSREYYEELYRAAGVAPKIVHRFTGYETVRSFVGQGHGYALLNQKVPANVTYSGGRVVALALRDQLPSIDVVLVRPAAGAPTQRALAFENVCAGYFDAEPDDDQHQTARPL